ncbi:MAG: tetratricopeptide repeat protein [Sedimentisphaerales bacterium]|nr:tetratricopeptide repeat protein [Sedimentisphaerales bacterium]
MWMSILPVIWLVGSSGSAAGQDYAELVGKSFEQADYSQAVEYYRQAIAEATSGKPGVELYFNLGHALSQLGKWDQAVGVYEKGLEVFEQSVSESGEAITEQQRKNQARVWRMLAQAQFMMGDYETAVVSRAQGDRLDPCEGGILFAARCYLALEQWSRAHGEIVNLLRERPGDLEAKKLLAYVLMQENRPSEAAVIWRDLIRRDLDNGDYFLALAQAEVSAGRYGGAIDALEFAVRVIPGGSERLNRALADLYLHEKMFRQAAGCYQRLIVSKQTVRAEDWFWLGYAFYQAGELVSAQKAFDQARQLDDSNYRTVYYVGSVAKQLGDIEKAREAFLAAAKLSDPAEQSETWLALGELEMGEGNFPAAAEYFSRAIELGQRSLAVHYNYVLALTKAEKFFEAKVALKQAFVDYPLEERLNLLLERLTAR